MASRATPAALALLAAVALAEGPGAPAGTAAAPGRPNIVVIMTDDQRDSDVRAMKAVRERLERHGTSFVNYFDSFPLCCPSRATLLTGQYAHNHRVLSNDPPHGGEPKFERAVPPGQTLPVRLDAAGYRTALIGKYLNAYSVPPAPAIPPGWDEWHALVNPGEYDMYGYSTDDNGVRHLHGSGPHDFQTYVLGREAVDFIRSSVGRPDPFFLELTPTAPHRETRRADPPRVNRNPRPPPDHTHAFAHAQLPKPPSFNERDVSDKPRFERDRRLRHHEIRGLKLTNRSRLASLKGVDDVIARVIKTLKRAGILGDTVVLFTSDNGYLLGEHREIGKELPYEESVAAPLVIRGPGFPAGAKRAQLAANIDLAPTILDLAGADRSGMDGVSLLRPANDPGARAGRIILFERSRFEGRAYKAVRTRRYVLISWQRRHGRPSARELYDLRRDPHQLRSVAHDHAYDAPKKRLERRLAKLRNCAGKSCR